MNNKLYFFSFLESTNWQMNFQDPATPIAGRIIEMHHHVFFFLMIVLIFVIWMVFRILYTFWWQIPEHSLQYHFKYLDQMQLLIPLKFNHNSTIEVIWTCMPSFILIAIAIPSFGLLYAMDDIVDPDITLKVIGHQWYWSYEYSDFPMISAFHSSPYGSSLSLAWFKDHPGIAFDSYMMPEDELTYGSLSLLEVDNSVMLPIGTYIRVNVTSADVLHSWAIPSLGIKMDAVPHRINSGIIFLQRTGVFYGQCSEICGVNHGFMPIAIKSVGFDKYYSWFMDKIIATGDWSQSDYKTFYNQEAKDWSLREWFNQLDSSKSE